MTSATAKVIPKKFGSLKNLIPTANSQICVFFDNRPLRHSKSVVERNEKKLPLGSLVLIIWIMGSRSVYIVHTDFYTRSFFRSLRGGGYQLLRE